MVGAVPQRDAPGLVVKDKLLDGPIDPSHLCMTLVYVPYSKAQRIHLQKMVESTMIGRLGLSSFTTMSSADLDYFFRLYYRLFFGSSLTKLKPKPHAQIMSDDNNNGDTVLGTYTFYLNKIDINLKLLRKALSNGALHEVCNGVVCRYQCAI